LDQYLHLEKERFTSALIVFVTTKNVHFGQS